MYRRLLQLLLFTILGTGVSARVQAQTVPESPPSPEPGAQAEAQAQASNAEYGSIVDRALAEYGRGNWPEAKVFFARAHALRPSARTLRGLGLTSYEMRSYVEACAFLRLALDSQEKPLTDEMRSQVQRALDEASSFVARYTVVLEPSSATLEVDERPPVEREGSLWLDPGAHVISARAEGFKPSSRAVTAQGGEHAELRFSLEPNVDAAAPLPTPEPEPAAAEIAPLPATAPPAQAVSSETGWNPQRTVGLGLAIGGVVAAGLGSTFGILAMHEKSASKSGCSTQGCDPGGYKHREAALSRAHVSTVTFVTAGVLLAAGTVVYLTADGEQEARAVHLQPELGLASAGLSLTGRW